MTCSKSTFCGNQLKLPGVIWPCPWSVFDRFAANGYCLKYALSSRLAQGMNERMTHE